MVGIYKITNHVTGKSYIGQSEDIEYRFKEHKWHKQLSIGHDIDVYGEENFSFEVLEECSVDKLDEKEDYYILKYDTRNNGYNIKRGGQHNIGESNSNAKLTEEDVYNIRECYKNHCVKREVYEKYGNKLTWLAFSAVWEGSTWTNIHMDVYTQANKDYYSKGKCRGSLSDHAVYTGQEVLEFREKYLTHTAEELYETEKDKISLDAFKKMLWGKTYKNVPIVYRKNKRGLDL